MKAISTIIMLGTLIAVALYALVRAREGKERNDAIYEDALREQGRK